jgi:hypothetical protein
VLVVVVVVIVVVAAAAAVVLVVLVVVVLVVLVFRIVLVVLVVFFAFCRWGRKLLFPSTLPLALAGVGGYEWWLYLRDYLALFIFLFL